MREKRSRLRIYNEPVQYVSKYLHNHYFLWYCIKRHLRDNSYLLLYTKERGEFIHTHAHTLENADVA